MNVDNLDVVKGHSMQQAQKVRSESYIVTINQILRAPMIMVEDSE